MEKKRRARINESLQELRTLLADTDVSIRRRTHTLHLSSPVLRDTDKRFKVWFVMEICCSFPQFHSKMENAEVLEMTVKKVEDVLKNRNQGLHNPVQIILYYIQSNPGDVSP